MPNMPKHWPLLLQAQVDSPHSNSRMHTATWSRTGWSYAAVQSYPRSQRRCGWHPNKTVPTHLAEGHCHGQPTSCSFSKHTKTCSQRLTPSKCSIEGMTLNARTHNGKQVKLHQHNCACSNYVLPQKHVQWPPNITYRKQACIHSNAAQKLTGHHLSEHVSCVAP